jgi:hypothetical protein
MLIGTLTFSDLLWRAFRDSYDDNFFGHYLSNSFYNRLALVCNVIKFIVKSIQPFRVDQL